MCYIQIIQKVGFLNLEQVPFFRFLAKFSCEFNGWSLGT